MNGTRSKEHYAPQFGHAVRRDGDLGAVETAVPGKRTQVEQVYGGAVQLRADAAPAAGPSAVQAAAARGVATACSKLPHGETLQRLFGRHDISAVQAHTGSEAAVTAREMGARAYAMGNHVVLGAGADLHTVAHEAAHVVQQRGGVQLKGGVGEVGDRYERHADAVADAVVQGKSAEALLDAFAQGSTASGTAGPAVQRLSGDDYDNTRLNHNGRTDRQNIRDAIVEAMRANLAGMDWSEYWNHITTQNHNTANPVGNSSTFGNDSQANIRGYIESVLNHYTPYFNTDRLVFESNTGGVCNGQHRDGGRTNVRVIVRVTELDDGDSMTNQVGSMVVENAYPI
jgi:hypothetical protein